jgi:hypothetical protein
MTTTTEAPAALTASMPPPAILASTRARFQSMTGAKEQHNALVGQPAFLRGMDFAMLALTDELADNKTNPDPAAVGLQLKGAKRFLEIFKKLAWQAPAPEEPVISDGLPNVNKERVKSIKE